MQRLILAILVLCSLLVGAARADNSVELLAAAQRAQATRAFEGVVVFMHDGKVDALRVVHHPGGSGYQHLTSLSGAPRALFRDQREARIEVPGGARRLPAVALGERVFDSARVDANYQMSDAGAERIAGLVARVIDARARDDVRYSQRLWINPETGLLLGVALIGPRRELLQQVMFTSLTVAAAAATPDAAPVAVAPFNGEAGVALPEGFRLIAERLDGSRRSLVMSDGLTLITLYLEPRNDLQDRLTTVRRGATQLAARQLGHVRAVAVGEVPSTTVVGLAERAVLALNH